MGVENRPLIPPNGGTQIVSRDAQSVVRLALREITSLTE